MSVFYASRKDNPTMRYIIKINKTILRLQFQYKQNQEYTTTFTEYFKVSEFLLPYHIKADLKNTENQKFHSVKRCFH